MKILYMNDSHAFISREELRDETPYDVTEIVARATTVKSSRDFVTFLQQTPASFFRLAAANIGKDFTAIEEICDPKAPYVFRESLIDTVDRHFPEIEALDEVALKSGAIGEWTESHEPMPLPDDGETTTGVLNAKPLEAIYLPTYEMLVQNIQMLERYAAVANGDKGPFKPRRLDLGYDGDIQFIDNQLWGPKAYAVGMAQQTTFHELFTTEQRAEVRKVLVARGYTDPFLAPTDKTHDTTHELASVCAYPRSWSDAEVCADMFLGFENGTVLDIILDDKGMGLASDSPFHVTRDAEGFHLEDVTPPVVACFREVARLAQAGALRLCANCGRPLIADRSRGNEAMYCSRSCNTMASAQRRETAYALAASGAPIERAVERIGARYEQSIRRWYQEAKDLLDK